jgi:hypothetical protein
VKTARPGCPDPDLLLERRSELIEPDVRSALDTHLASCDACAQMAADLDALKLDVPDGTVEAEVLSRLQSRRPSLTFWRVPLAAAVVIGCAGSIAWWMRPAAAPTSAPDGATVGKPAASAVPVAPAAPVAPVVAMWTVEALPVRVPLSAVGVSRSTTSSQASSALVDALAAYQIGRYTDAIPPLREVAGAQPDSGEAALYLGVALLLADQPRDALQPLERAARQVEASRRADVEWYRATAEQRVGQTTAARNRLDALCAVAGPYQQPACAAGQALR